MWQLSLSTLQVGKMLVSTSWNVAWNAASMVPTALYLFHHILKDTSLVTAKVTQLFSEVHSLTITKKSTAALRRFYSTEMYSFSQTYINICLPFLFPLLLRFLSTLYIPYLFPSPIFLYSSRTQLCVKALT